ncbi:cation diffusion facilitator family transporter [Synechococcus sp. PCC 7335]|uniref:cation diffusion facilitator family transporter n=1 Tax=Synechococcus sp. (strain ATCC 29403 / PCC 7335) TaxID=91464 RepID=UPI0012FC7CB3|nr:cation diffusion facilitator family transporter [Synechococcus sp. PCC 7335]
MKQLSIPKSLTHSHHHVHQPGEDTHTHGTIDPAIATSERGLWAVKVSLICLTVTAIAQAGVFWLSGSVALLADLIHNVGDAMTALPLGVAFILGRRKPTKRFAYGYGRVEDLAGVAVVGVILLSALITAYESINRFYHPQPIHHIGALAMAALIGFVGNETVAIFRTRVGREINSAALVADGQHALADGLVSLAVLVSAIGVWAGYSWADPLVGLVITGLLLKIVWESGQTIFTRLLDGVEPELVDTLRHLTEHVTDIRSVEAIRARWLGHRLYAELDVVIAENLSVKEGQAIAEAVNLQLQEHIPYLENVMVRITC